MPWTYNNPPKVSTNWTDQEKRDCVDAANSVLEEGGSEEEAILACISSAGKQKAVSDLDLTPPKSAQNNAKRGLDLRKEWGRGGTDVGVARARDISNGSRLSPKTIKRMASFNRHRGNYKPDDKESDGGPTAGTIAWLLWGGTTGIDWALRMSKRIDEEKGDNMEKIIKHYDFKVTETKEIERNQVKYGVVKGYASTFNNIDRGNDIIAKEAFEKTIERHKQMNRPIRMQWQHKTEDLIGGFPTFKVDEKGLYVEGEINLEVQKGREAYALAKQGVLSDMSIGFVIRNAEMIEVSDGFEDGVEQFKQVRKILDVELYEISLVSEPMNPLAQITAIKSLEDDLTCMKDISKMFKELGFTNLQSNVIISKIKEFTPARNERKNSKTSNRNDEDINRKLDDILMSLELNTINSKLHKGE